MSNWQTLEFFHTDPGIALLQAGVVLWALLPVVMLFRIDARLRKVADEVSGTRQVLAELGDVMAAGSRAAPDGIRRRKDRFERITDRMTTVNRDQQIARKAGVR